MDFIKSFSFPAGERNIQVDVEALKQAFFDGRIPGTYCIELRDGTPQSLFDAILSQDALRRAGVKRVALRLLYAPYSRQDRIDELGQAFGLKIFCDLVNKYFDEVVILDPHSDVVTALLNNVRVITQADVMRRLPAITPQATVLVCPDSGARKKIHKVAAAMGIADILYCDKRRDTRTGALSGFSCDLSWVTPLEARDFIIVDDLIDGGGTFIEIAKMIRPLTTGRINLAASFGIFSKGVGVFEGVIDRIFVAETMDQTLDHPLLKRIQL